MARRIDLRDPHGRAALRRRLATLLSALQGDTSGRTRTTDLVESLKTALANPTLDRIWLALAVLNGRLPTRATVLETTRRARLDGSLRALAETITPPRAGWPVVRETWPEVEVVTHGVLLDLHHTATTGLATGIQRVAKNVASRWYRDHSPILVGWTRQLDGLRRLDPVERSRVLDDRGAVDGSRPAAPPEVVIPWGCTYVLPELMTEPERARRLLSLLEYSGCESSFIGFDCVPLSSAETTSEAMDSSFAQMLAAAARCDRLATISETSAAEFRAWRSMLAGAGLSGPEITPIALPMVAPTPNAESMATARQLLGVGALPLVLVVGSHEPRKNHLAVLHAAELVWRDGIPFNLVFVGGNAWHAERFIDRVRELQGIGRPVLTVPALPDDSLWAAYKLARCTVFPSFNEGFGLPVAESLASGTPVIASNFGSMKEIAQGGGGLLVDPRNDHDIAKALRTLLTDDDLHAAKSLEARARVGRSWDEYAAEAWEYLVHGSVPEKT